MSKSKEVDPTEVMEVEPPKKKRIKRVCAVAVCPNPQDSVYHCFPKDNEMQKKWATLTRRADKVNVKTARICATHFTRDDYVQDVVSHLYPDVRRRLKPDAVPSQLLTHTSQSEQSIARAERACVRAQKNIRYSGFRFSSPDLHDTDEISE